MAVSGIILAAGKGTRMKSDSPKVLCKMLFKPLVQWVVDASREAGVQDLCVVTGHGRQQVMQALEGQCEFAVQEQQLGTGHAVQQCAEFLKQHQEDTVVLLCGDTPLIESDTIKALCNFHQEEGNSATVLIGKMEDPTGYGRVIRDGWGDVTAIVEQKDATEEQKAVREINSGIYAFKGADLLDALGKLKNDNAQKEFYLTDTISILSASGHRVGGFVCEDQAQIMGINDRVQLYEAQQIAKERIFHRLQVAGVTIYDKASTFIAPDAVIGEDTEILPGTIIRQGCTIGRGCVIGPQTDLRQMTIGDHTSMDRTVAIESTVGEHVTAGPFTYIRPNCHIGNHIKVGDFVEVKNANVGDGCKLPHLSYIGDSDLGEGINIGCGTVTCNYDGKHKHRTVIGSHSFIGCNTNLVAPVTVEEGAYIAAGSTITDTVPKDNFSIARARQVNKEDWKKKREESNS